MLEALNERVHQALMRLPSRMTMAIRQMNGVTNRWFTLPEQPFLAPPNLPRSPRSASVAPV